MVETGADVLREVVRAGVGDPTVLQARERGGEEDLRREANADSCPAGLIIRNLRMGVGW